MIASHTRRCYNDVKLASRTEDPRTVQLPSSLHKAFNTTLNELGADMALIALKEDGFGPFVADEHRGFVPREIQAVVRALAHPGDGFDGAAGNGGSRRRGGRLRRTARPHRPVL